MTYWEYFKFKGKVKSCEFLTYKEMEITPDEDEVKKIFIEKEKLFINMIKKDELKKYELHTTIMMIIFINIFISRIRK